MDLDGIGGLGHDVLLEMSGRSRIDPVGADSLGRPNQILNLRERQNAVDLDGLGGACLLVEGLLRVIAMWSWHGAVDPRNRERGN